MELSWEAGVRKLLLAGTQFYSSGVDFRNNGWRNSYSSSLYHLRFHPLGQIFSNKHYELDLPMLERSARGNPHINSTKLNNSIVF